ncbi:efflux RND transporter permease subunit [Halovenus marina]|uniref:efflux RND transporter permease subunit n=1 Tax=Halovenus marina TaxID=3396621 RepID=UPI003F56B15E
MSLPERLSGAITARTRPTIVVLLLVVAGVGAGAPAVDSVTSLEQFQTESEQSDALDYIETNFEGEGETTIAQVVVRGENVLSRESLVAMLEYQQRLHETDVVRTTFVDENPTFSVANAIAQTAYRQQLAQEDGGAEQANGEVPTLSLSEQQQLLQSVDSEQLQAAVSAALGPGQSARSAEILSLMPTDYEPGATTAEATVISVTQVAQTDSAVNQAAGEETIDAQLEMRSIGAEMSPDEYQVFGSGIISHEISASMSDSLTVVAPLALAFVLLTLTIAYRDPLDILLGLFGIGAVLLMTFGFMGWTGIDFGQVFVAVPVLLIGLSIDYAIHIFMRHREHRGADGTQAGVREAMHTGLAGVGVALVFVTATTAIGFLSNVTSPVQPIREFGIVSAAGIVSALVIFGALVPAIKVELDELLEARGWDRSKRAFGTGGGQFSSLLAVGSRGARRAPAVVIAVVLLLGVAGAAGALQVDTSFDQEDFLADDPPEWMTELPEPFAPETYTAKSSLQFVNERFIRSDATAEILIRGEITDSQTIVQLSQTRARLAQQDVTQTLPTGQPAIESPLSLLAQLAEENPEFGQQVQAADTNGDGIPDQNIADLYDGMFELAPERAAEYIHRTDDEYRALRLTVAVRGDAPSQDVTDQMQSVADDLSGDTLRATVTGTLILNTVIQDQLLDTVFESLAITLVAVFLFLMAAYRITNGSASLGAVTLAPVAIATAWIGGSMYLLSIPFNVITGMILSLTIGLGVAYSIHVSERYTLELERQSDVWAAMETSVTGTGGALLGSAATTVGGFGVLVFAILPPLRQFGLITALSIIYAFIGSVLVLPTLLTLWTRVAGPEWARDQLRGPQTAQEQPPGRRESNSPRTVEIQLPDTRQQQHEQTLTFSSSGRARVVVEIPPRSGRVALRESINGGTASVESVQPEPETLVSDGQRLYSLWELDGEPARLVYTVERSDPGTVRFDGAILDGDGSHPVDGPRMSRGSTSISDPERDSGESGQTLDAASDALAAGEIDDEQYEQVLRAWLSGQ